MKTVSRLALLPVLLVCLWSADHTVVICNIDAITIEHLRETQGGYFEGFTAIAHTGTGRTYELYRAHLRADVEGWVEQAIRSQGETRHENGKKHHRHRDDRCNREDR